MQQNIVVPHCTAKLRGIAGAPRMALGAPDKIVLEGQNPYDILREVANPSGGLMWFVGCRSSYG